MEKTTTEPSSCCCFLSVVAAFALLVVAAANLARVEVNVSPRLAPPDDRYGEGMRAGEIPAWTPIMKPSESVEKEEQDVAMELLNAQALVMGLLQKVNVIRSYHQSGMFNTVHPDRFVEVGSAIEEGIRVLREKALKWREDPQQYGIEEEQAEELWDAIGQVVWKYRNVVGASFRKSFIDGDTDLASEVGLAQMEGRDFDELYAPQ